MDGLNNREIETMQVALKKVRSLSFNKENVIAADLLIHCSPEYKALCQVISAIINDGYEIRINITTDLKIQPVNGGGTLLIFFQKEADGPQDLFLDQINEDRFARVLKFIMASKKEVEKLNAGNEKVFINEIDSAHSLFFNVYLNIIKACVDFGLVDREILSLLEHSVQNAAQFEQEIYYQSVELIKRINDKNLFFVAPNGPTLHYLKWKQVHDANVQREFVRELFQEIDQDTISRLEKSIENKALVFLSHDGQLASSKDQTAVFKEKLLHIADTFLEIEVKGNTLQDRMIYLGMILDQMAEFLLGDVQAGQIENSYIEKLSKNRYK